MLKKWRTTLGDSTTREVPIDVMRLALHNISKIGFGVGLLWTGEKASVDENTQDAVFNSVELPEGHSMSYETSMDTLLTSLVWVILTLEWLKKCLPFQGAQKAYESFVNCGQYMQELIAQKVEEGARSCLGRRLDQVKVIVVLSVIFQRYSLELAVDEWATDDEVANKGHEQRKRLYKVAQDKARRRSATTQITLGLHEGLGSYQFDWSRKERKCLSTL